LVSETLTGFNRQREKASFLSPISGIFLYRRRLMMSVRFVLPVAALALTLGMAGESYAQGSSSTQVRPAQMPQASECDELMQQVEIEMPSAVGLRVAAAQSDIEEARELCNSGQPREGAAILRGVLNDVHEGG
jgi:hypothetical protein